MKVAICTPCYENPKLAFYQSAIQMAVHSTKQGMELESFVFSSANLIYSRNILYDLARDWGADYILWLDADHQFPRNALERLLGAKCDIIGANYVGRWRPAEPMACKIVDGVSEPVWTTREKAEAGKIEQVAGLGLGLCLMRMSVLAKLDPVFEPPRDDWTLFERLLALGIPIYVDHWLSWRTGHVATQILTNETAEFDRIEFKLRRATKEGSANADTVLPAAGDQ